MEQIPSFGHTTACAHGTTNGNGAHRPAADPTRTLLTQFPRARRAGLPLSSACAHTCLCTQPAARRAASAQCLRAHPVFPSTQTCSPPCLVSSADHDRCRRPRSARVRSGLLGPGHARAHPWRLGGHHVLRGRPRRPPPPWCLRPARPHRDAQHVPLRGALRLHLLARPCCSSPPRSVH